MGKGRDNALLWLFASVFSFLLALYPLSATLVGGTYIPGDPDSFYHAHRILDALAAPTHLYQFDPRIHAPEGSWITWPWAYDMLLAWIGHVAVYTFGVKQPLAVLAYIAPCWTAVNAALVLGIANRLELSFPLRILAVACYAASPLTQALHRVGMLDHHFVELTFVLATVLLGLGWLQQLSSVGRAAALGALLGIAPAFHNGLFVLQVPVLITLAVRWLLGRQLPDRGAATFAGSLLLSTFVFLLPSEPFRNGDFDFALQSWFHVFAAASTCLFACLFSRLPRSWGSAGVLAIASGALTGVIGTQALRAGMFLTGHLVKLSKIGEVEGIFGHLADHDYGWLVSIYSGLLWIAPLPLAYLFWRLRRGSSTDRDLFFAIACLCGAVLFTLQYRFENYGSFALYFPLLLMTQDAIERWRETARWIVSATAIGIAALYLPTVSTLTGKMPLSASLDYEMTRDVYPTLAQACERHPGIVIADSADGHYITYHTHCSVIADDFIMTRQHEEKLLQLDRLLSARLEEALREMPQVRYIYVRRNDNIFTSACGERACAVNRGLRQELLFANSSPPGLRLLKAIDFQLDATHREPLARVFEVIGPSARTAVSANPN